MRNGKIDLQKYLDAIRLIKKNSIEGNPMKMTDFLNKFELNKTLFRIMEELKYIKVKSQGRSEGTIFEWYNQPSNFSYSSVAMKVVDRLQEDGRKIYTKYNSPEWKAKRKIKEIPPRIVSKTPINRIQKEEIPIENNPIINTEILVNKSTETQPDIFIPVPQLNSPAIQEPIKKVKELKSEIFECMGNFSKDEMIKKLSRIIEDESISSFKITLEYK